MGAEVADLIVIGSGFWGCSTALKAREAGLEAVVIDNGNEHGASRNAAGLVCAEWYKGKEGRRFHPTWTFRGIGASMAWLTHHGLQRTGETFDGPAGRKRREDRYLLRSITGFLSEARRVRGDVTHISRVASGWRVHLLDGSTMVAGRVVIAAGVWTDTLLKASGLEPLGVEPLRGRALILRGMPVVPWGELPHTVQIRPYLHHTLRPWGWTKTGLQTYRLGDTVERNAGTGAKAFAELEASAKRLMVSHERVAVMDGYRPVCDRFAVLQAAPHVVAMSGGGRIGLGVAGLAADTALRILGVEHG